MRFVDHVLMMSCSVVQAVADATIIISMIIIMDIYGAPSRVSPRRLQKKQKRGVGGVGDILKK